MADNSYTDIMEKNHMEIPWHDYAKQDGNILIDKAGLIEKASVIGRVGLIMLSCGTGAWRVRTSMNRLSKELGVTCTVDVGLMSIEFNCFDGNDCISQSLSIANTGVNTSKLYRMEQRLLRQSLQNAIAAIKIFLYGTSIMSTADTATVTTVRSSFVYGSRISTRPLML